MLCEKPHIINLKCEWPSFTTCKKLDAHYIMTVDILELAKWKSKLLPFPTGIKLNTRRYQRILRKEHHSVSFPIAFSPEL